MSGLRLRPSAEIVEADWLGPRLRPFRSSVAAVVPDGFPAYVRLLHPAPGPDGEPVRWTEIAAWSGRKMHRLVQFQAITRPSPSAQLGAGPSDGVEPPTGNLPAAVLRVLCRILAEHTSTATSCWFCLWEGYGWLHGSPAISVLSRSGDSPPVPPAATPEVLQGPRVRLPNRNYVLFKGPLIEAPELGWTTPGGDFIPRSPNLFWPQDRAWCVASEIDLSCTLIAGSEALAETIVADSRLEAWRVEPGDPITFDSDQINE